MSEFNNSSEYSSEEYGSFIPSEPPNYYELDSWAVHPLKKNKELNSFINGNEKLNINVFFIHPTLFWDNKNTSWNSDIYDPKMRYFVNSSSVKYQASAWASVGDLFVPHYRQAHIRVFRESFWLNGGEQAYELAYTDVKKAFEIFLEKYNDNKPIIIAGHSQGAGHAKKILQEFFDGKPLQKKLVAAYLIGTKITEKDFINLKLMNTKDETGGFVTWNTYRLMSERKTKKASLTVNQDWIKGALCSNPIRWDTNKTSNYEDHKGFLYFNKKIYPNTVKIEHIDNKVYIKLPKMGIFKKILVSTVKDYHKADISLFWEDIRINSINRAKVFLNK
ncbi:uncharacterized protein METZ01_LOCUS36627 [marine metagenome]|uniref:DUF3089 domain-containing protein n=1 Tax=marine metagenome TaxID=408172 RepID=A0A381R2E7_9ZZZZ